MGIDFFGAGTYFSRVSVCKHDLANHSPARIVYASQPLKFWSAEEVALVALFQVACIFLFGGAYLIKCPGSFQNDPRSFWNYLNHAILRRSAPR